MSPVIYQIKIVLKEIEPPIWRRFKVRSDLTLRAFHRVLQEIMGWTNSHLHKFEINGVEYAHPDPEYEDFEMDIKDDRRVRLEQLVTGEGQCFEYQYDFGDSWDHYLVVEKILPVEMYCPGAVCLEGARACPPEDVGSTSGYEEFLEAIRHPNHEEHKRMLIWAGGAFDPEAFDLNRINRNLQRLVRAPSRKKTAA